MLQRLPDLNFNSWTIVFLLFAFQGILNGLVFIFADRRRHPAKAFIGFILLAFSATLIAYTGVRTGFIVLWPPLGIIGGITPFVFGPLLYMYISCLKEGRTKRVNYLHLTAGLLVLILYLPTLFFREKEQFLNYLNNPIVTSLPFLKLCHLALYGILSYREFAGSTEYSEIRKWGKALFIFYAGFVAIECYPDVINATGLSEAHSDVPTYFLMSVFILFVGIFGHIQPRIFDGYSLNNADLILAGSVKYKTSGLTPAASEELYLALTKLMQEEKLYLDNAIKLDKLAEKLNSRRHHLSQVINEKSGVGFFEYINRLRIAEAKQLLQEKSKQELNAIEVGYIVGFNNKVTFNNAFKKETGLTPSEFRRKYRQTGTG